MIAGLRNPASHKRLAIGKLKQLLQLVLFALGACLISSAHAFKQGHSRLVSPPGKPLEIILPITQLSAEDAKSLKVEVASASLWSQSGLIPPVSLDQLRVSVRTGASADGRMIVVQSSQPSNRAVVDVLLTLSTASGSSQLQVSLLQPEFAPVDLASNQPSIKVQPGDTLYGIAQRNLVPGASIHQMLWALFEANPDAFISENMNLLRSGAVLRIPDAKTVLSTDAATARSRFLEHDARFKSLRGKRAGTPGQLPQVGSASTAKGKLTSPALPSAEEQSTQDRLRLSNAQQDRESDKRASTQKEIADHQARIGQLQQNIQQLQQALGQTADSGSLAGGDSNANTGAQSGATSASLTGSKSLSAPASGTGSSTAASADSAGSARNGMSSAGSGKTVEQSSVSGLAAKPANPGQPSDANTQHASGQGQKESHVAKQWLMDHLLVVLTALFVILVFLIGMRMRRESARRDDGSEDPDAAEMSPAAKSAFEKKLQSIDLNLDSTEAPSGDSKKTTP